MKNLKPAAIFQDGMVLQRQKPVRVWGEGPDGVLLTVTFNDQSVKVQIKEEKWSCELPAMEALTEGVLSILADSTDIDPIHFQNISVGDVWIAGGQSNMEYFLRYDAQWESVKNLPFNPYIHMYNCPRLAFPEHAKDTSDSGFWFTEQNAAWETFSTPGYSFARNLQSSLNIPLGIIGCNWGGTTASSWIDESYLQTPELSVYLDDYQKALEVYDANTLYEKSMEAWANEDSISHQQDFTPVMYGISEEEQQKWVEAHADDPVLPMGPYNHNRPGGLYHQMLKKIAPFPIKGVIWYQGESDSNYPNLYDKLFSSMIRCWRETWKDAFPFLFVQLAPFEKWLTCEGSNYPVVREMQELVSKTVPNTGMISIMDLGMYEDIHPKRKMEVGERLALLARGMVYGEDILCLSPEFHSAHRDGNAIHLKFLHAGEGLFCTSTTVNGLEILQSKSPLFPVSVSIRQDTLTLRFEELSEMPCQILFAKTPYVEVNLYNSADLPAKPFQCEI